MKTYVALVRDHSGSMGHLATQAANDYNLTLNGIKQSIAEEGQDAFVTVVECGVGYRGEVRTVTDKQPINSVKNITSYHTTGSSTPLWDSVGEAIENIENVLDKDDLTVAFLVMITTDGQNNVNRRWDAKKIAEKIRALQNTDRWTFVFRVPRGDKAALLKFGIPEFNIMEWEQTSQSLQAATQATTSGVTGYFQARSQGKTASTRFYTDLASLSTQDIRQALQEVSGFRRSIVPAHLTGTMIKTYCESVFGDYSIGSAYYELTKPETLRDSKEIVIEDKISGKMYSGASARQLLGFPAYGNIKIVPGSLGNYRVFVQSTSVNRKLVGGSEILYK